MKYYNEGALKSYHIVVEGDRKSLCGKKINLNELGHRLGNNLFSSLLCKKCKKISDSKVNNTGGF
ncbi:hypothetical protein [Senegalia massiliensis]|uniref:Uncharacterized protein n=1 Tax=Senegalia massiliensis TaxID=1720316 RepID=A0A845R091_9CLOT|nr:hypothetical protein [Senegalia massiliensis]NBI07634.1 hypothetical protein [Senegalia massiliensis]